MKPLISIIIPVYNHAHSLERSLHSLFEQSYRPIEVIVVNDGSTDNFREVMDRIALSSWASELPIGILEQPNKGASAARNAGFKMVKGEYVIFWDADTIGMKDMLREMAEKLENEKDAAYAYSKFKFGWKKMKSQEFDPDDLKKYNFIDTTSLIRKSSIRLAAPFDETLKKFQDWDLWLSLLREGKTGTFVPRVLYKKEVGKREGISSWLPSFVYKLPFKTKEIRKYDMCREIVLRKHRLLRKGM